MYLVVDVGGTFVKYAIMDAEGTIIKKDKQKTPVKPGQGTADFVELVAGIYEEYTKEYDLEGIAMDLPGQIDVERQIVYGGGGLKYLDGAALGDLLHARLGDVRIAMENDGKCAALAEVWKGSASDCQNACVLAFGTGVGGGVIKDRKIHRGSHLVAGELSYTLDKMTRADISKIKTSESIEGVRETIEIMPFIASAQISTYGVTLQAANLKRLPFEEVDGVKIYQWASQGDTQIQELLEDWYFNIAKLCCNIYVLYDPDVILIGGGISAQPLFTEGIQRYVEQLKKISNIFHGMRVSACKFLNDSNLLGALYHYKQMYENV